MALSQKAVLFSVFIISFFIYFFLLFGTTNLPICCDASLYLIGGRRLVSDGLLFQNVYSGYRSVLNYGFVESVRSIGAMIATITFSSVSDKEAYTIGAITIFVITGILLITQFGHRKEFLLFFLAVYLNPITVAMLPYPIQESQMVLLIGPTFVISGVLLATRNWPLAIISLWVLSSLLWMVKGSLALIALPIAVLSTYLFFKDASRHRIPTLMGVALATVVIGPQSYVTQLKFGTLYPYPQTGVLFKQIQLGQTAWHYETVYAQNRDGSYRWQGEFSRNTNIPTETTQEYFAQIYEAPYVIVGNWVGHLYSAFNYSNPQVYIISQFTHISILNFALGSLFFVGFQYRMARLASSGYDVVDFYCDSILIGAVALLPLLAVETRFSYLATVILLWWFFRWSSDWRTNKRKIADISGGLVFGSLFAFAMLLVDNAG